MSIWARITEFASVVFSTDQATASGLESRRSGSECASIARRDETFVCGPDEGDVAFTAAIIGLGAKLAKADGLVTADEVDVFRKVFRTPVTEQKSVERVFNLARQSVHGYQSYAMQIAKRYGDRPCLLEGVLDGLFQIALADGVMTLDELEYLKSVSDAFGFSDADFSRIKAGHMGPDPEDPYMILGVDRNADFKSIRLAYRKLMMDHHPDKMAIMKDAPTEYEQIAHEKAAAITGAFAKIRTERGLLVQPD